MSITIDEVKELFSVMSAKCINLATILRDPVCLLGCSWETANKILTHAKSLPSIVSNVKASSVRKIELHNNLEIEIKDYSQPSSCLRGLSLDGVAFVNPKEIPPSWHSLLWFTMAFPGVEVICYHPSGGKGKATVEYGVGGLNSYLKAGKDSDPSTDRLPGESSVDWFKRIMS